MKKLLALIAIAAGVGMAGGITGQVVDAITGDPIQGAMVVARGESDAGRARTNGRGVYLIEDLEPGDYRVSAVVRGYEQAGFPRAVPVQRGVTEGISFRLTPLQREAGVITGRVVCARTGEPIANAKVVAAGEDGRFRARTNERGVYVLRVRPGMYRVMANARHYRRAAFPRPVGVRAGQTVEDVSFRLVPKPRRGAILGVVVDARTREPIAGAVVVARGEQGAFRTRTDRRGAYKLVAEPGAYRVVAMARGYGQQSFPRAVPVRPGEATRDIDFVLRRAALDSY